MLTALVVAIEMLTCKGQGQSASASPPSWAPFFLCCLASCSDRGHPGGQLAQVCLEEFELILSAINCAVLSVSYSSRVFSIPKP